MPEAAVAHGEKSIHDKQARYQTWAAMQTLADGLTDQGLDILGQEREEDFCLKATNAWGALCEATVGPGQLFRWEYRSADGGWTDPAQIAAMAMILLGADDAADARDAPSRRYPGQTFKSAVGLTAREHGMQAKLANVIRDDELLEVGAEVEITDPARLDRGRVLASDTAICWECTFVSPNTGGNGLDVAEVVEAIGRSVPQLKVMNAGPLLGSRRPDHPT
ncbi:MAG: hypothetical protein ACRDRJ_16295 [Streptosporangiaceae bacterium]